ncbi:MAG: hypothetical protein CTY28_11320 [Hyphomicrobium sp.]|nr:MAG: hypothetical protein CTY28_11320 [Hyphomicrobium sp.]
MTAKGRAPATIATGRRLVMKIQILIAFLFLLGSQAHGIAEDQPPVYSANYWLAVCDAGIAAGDEKLCAGYFQGLIAANDVLDVSVKKPWFCLPDGVTTRQLYEVVKRDIPPQMWTDPFGFHAVIILGKRFPCKRK